MTMESMILNLYRSANRSRPYAWKIAALKKLIQPSKELLITVPTKHSPAMEPRLLYLLTLTQTLLRLETYLNSKKEEEKSDRNI